jgi:DNA-binding transcriptional regulator LsrR (DeoR family)
MMDQYTGDWWADLHQEVLDCLALTGRSTPAEVGRRLGMSESGATSLLAMMAREGKVRIAVVEPISVRESVAPAA